MSEVAHLVGVSRTTVYAIKKRMDDDESVTSCAGISRKTVVDRDSLRDAIQRTASNSRHSSLIRKKAYNPVKNLDLSI